MKKLPDITILSVDCITPKSALKAIEYSLGQCEFGKAKLLTNEDVESEKVEIIKIKKISTKQMYSKFCYSELWKYVDTEYALIVQADGFVLRGEAWNDKYLQYDYIGAPSHWIKSMSIVGNGGFSLRSKKLLHEMSRIRLFCKYHPEDYTLCVTYREYLEKKGISFSPIELAKTFSVDGEIYKDQFGFHGYQYLPKRILNKLLLIPEFLEVYKIKEKKYLTK